MFCEAKNKLFCCNLSSFLKRDITVHWSDENMFGRVTSADAEKAENSG